MNIKLAKENLLLEGDFVKVLIANQTSTNSKIVETMADLFLGDVPGISDSGKVIATPGEYEIQDSLIYAREGMYAIDIDGIKIVYIANSVNDIPTGFLDQIGIVNVAILEMGESEIEKRVEILDDLEPEIFIPILKSKEQNKEIATALGVDLPESTNKIKLTASQFGQDDVPLSLMILE